MDAGTDSLPSFETPAAPAPQDEVGIFSRPFLNDERRPQGAGFSGSARFTATVLRLSPEILIRARTYIQPMMSQCMSAGAYLYILQCADGSYYVGTTRKSLEERLGEYNTGLHRGYTSSRRPVTMVFAQHFETITDAVAAERQVKGWSRAKKKAMIDGAWNRLPDLAKRRSRHPKKSAG